MGTGFEIAICASQEVLTALERVQRTEDVKFSPNSRRLALAGFSRNVIAVADVHIEIDGRRPRVTVADLAEFSSPCLNGPHGLEFLDDETMIVANRSGDVIVLGLPSDGADDRPAELTPVDLPPDHGFELLDGPSALSVAARGDGDFEVLVCNNYGNTLTRHVLHDGGSADQAVMINAVLLRQRLAVPDGVVVSPDGGWIAVSNHDRHRVMLYERSSALHEGSDPHGILRGAWCPHGIRFSADGRSLFVADADSPYVRVYLSDGGTWRGVQFHPADSVRVMADDVFQRGRGPGQGGPKGIDIDCSGRVLAVTCECQPLAFFDVSAILERTTERRHDDTRHLSDELEIMEQERLGDARFEARIASIKGTMSWRMTEPLRRLKAAWSRQRR